ncbi:MAG: TonB-dependent receptor [Lewinella sp.]|nr:TonB-dependent receptor [Lewinella sp.]
MKNLITLLGIIGALPLFAQSSTSIEGRVTEANGEPVTYANVILRAAADSSLIKVEYTEDDGTFRMVNLPTGDHFLIVSYVGLPTYSSEVFTLEADQTLTMPGITMEEAPTDLAEVTVTARKPLVEVRPDMTVFNVDKAVNAAGNNAMELLRRAPGVVVDNNDNIMLLGKSGVRIFIDGKPSPLGGEDLAAFLRNMQASDIEAIEVITSPSARYEAEGNAGIINIRLKKDQSLGTNGNLDLSYAVSTHSRYGASLGLNHRNDNVNVFGKYSHYEGHNANYNDFLRHQAGTQFDQFGRNRYGWNNHLFRAGADFDLGGNHTMGVLASGSLNDFVSVNNSATEISDELTGDPISRLRARTEEEGERDNLNLNFNYRFDNREGQVWNFDADYALFRNTAETYQPNRYYDPTDETLVNEVIYGINTPTNIDLLSFKLDHERPLLGGSLATGAKVSYVVTDNDFGFYNYADGEPIYSPMQSNRFEYTENINALYGQYQRKFGEKTSMQAGLRLEHTHSIGDLTSEQVNDNDRVERDYVNLFPSAGISYQLNEKNGLRLGYSYRVDRPRYQSLNPFEDRLDELTFQKGNPFLQPQFTHNVELTHTYNYRFNTTLSYAITNDMMAEIIDTLSGNRAFLTTRNLATQKVLSLNVSVPFSVTPWWNVFANASLSHINNEGVFEEGKTVDITRTTFNIYQQHTFTLPKGIMLEISGWYNSPTVYGGNMQANAQGSLDAGLSTKVLDGRGRVRLSVSDILLTNRWSGLVEFGDLRMDVGGGWESRQLRLNFTYNFGNQEVQSSRRRQTGLEDEKSRVGGDN